MPDGSAIPEIRLGRPIVEDFAYLARRMRPDEIEQFTSMSGFDFDADVAARAFVMTPGQTFVLVDRGNMPVVAGGFEPLRPGVYSGWMVGTTEGWSRYWRAITRHTRRLHDKVLSEGAHRIEIIAKASRVFAHDWYERGLLMEREGVLRGYCADGSDAVMFSRVKGE